MSMKHDQFVAPIAPKAASVRKASSDNGEEN